MLRSTLRPFALACGFACAAAGSATAQQFELDHVLPGGSIWSEGLEAADIENDGDLDVFIARGNGFASAGTPQQNSLILNQLEIAPQEWSDVSVSRLGVHTSNAKMVVTGDIQGDGYVDALFANAFNIELPFLYVNRGAAQPGFFDFDGVNRGFTTVLNSGDAAFGDTDNDGDLDVVICDAGSSFVGGGAPGRPIVYVNDGNGFFTEDVAATAAAAAISGGQDMHLVDIDNDWDLDIWGPNHVDNHFLLLNDGSGTFSDASGLIPNTSNNVYEADVSDLDADGDMDFFFISLSGFNDGPMENNLIPSGSLSFTNGVAGSGNDDNEISFCDFDNDGDLDAFIARLGGAEKLRENNGGLNFTGATFEIESFVDSSLDCTHFDYDNDGDYDFLTSNGESGTSWQTKVYTNNGAADTLPPVVQRVEPLSDCEAAAGPWVVRAVVQDQVMDDGKDWLSAQVDWDVDGVAGSAAGLRVGTGMYRFEMTDTAGGLGSLLTYTLSFTDWAGNTTTTSPTSVCLCGSAQFAVGAHPANFLDMNVVGAPASVGSSFTVETTGIPGGATFHANLVCLGELTFPFLGGVGVVDVTSLVTILGASPAGGTASNLVPVPANPALAGFSIYMQGLCDGAGGSGYALSNGLKVTICD